jgi:DNA-binding winged helix-turn-helix (wHTH) protein/Tol biopolymer transport system component
MLDREGKGAAQYNLKFSRSVRFGAFELFLDTGELRKHGVRVRLQGKPFHLLSALVEQPGQLVTREQLRSRLWSSDTFVDFESGLNTAVNRLRIALGESADHPVYIETLARLGYRFIAPIEIVSPPHQATEGSLQVSPKLGEELRSTAGEPVRGRPPAFFTRRVPLYASLGSFLFVAILVLEHSLSRHSVTFQQITFQKGSVSRARFSRDGKEIVYSAESNGHPSRVSILGKSASEPRELSQINGYLASVSPAGGIAIRTTPNGSNKGRLISLPPSGGNPEALKNQAIDLDFGTGGNLCTLVEDRSILSVECPVGRKVYTSTGWIANMRISPNGHQVAFAEHLIPRDDAGRVVLVDTISGQSRILSSGWESLNGLAWQPSGREVWFTAAHSGVDRALQAVDLTGRVRLIAALPGALVLQDISPEGKVLITEGPQRVSMILGNADTAAFKDISWLDWSNIASISPDGKFVLFDESGAGGGKQYSVFLYSPADKVPQRIGDGRALDLSNDGHWALTQSATDASVVTLHSLRNRTSWQIPTGGISYTWAKFIPDRQEILLEGNYPNRAPELFRQALPDGLPIPLHKDIQMENVLIDAAGNLAVGAAQHFQIVILDLTTNELRFVPRQEGYYPSAVLDKDEALVSHVSGNILAVDLLDLMTGRTRPYRRITLLNETGVDRIMAVHFAADRKTFAFSSHQAVSNLFLVSGWR